MLLDTEGVRHSLNEGRLPCAEVAGKRDDVTGAQCGRDRLADRPGLLGGSGLKLQGRSHTQAENLEQPELFVGGDGNRLPLRQEVADLDEI